jgi:hypothetical membrane protein
VEPTAPRNVGNLIAHQKKDKTVNNVAFDTSWRNQLRPDLLTWLSYVAIGGCIIFALSILIADFVVPDHDWLADTISDLGAGRYEFIVDIGIYAFSGSLLAIALCAAHLHLGGPRWSFGLIGVGFMALIIFLIGARNEYGDNDSEGVVIHVYLVYALGLIMTLAPWLMSGGAYRAGRGYGHGLIAVSIIWTVSAPFFFFLPTGIDGIYERYLGLIAFAFVGICARLFLAVAREIT